MTRRFIALNFTLLLVLTLAPLTANACEKGATCEVDRSCEKTETGIRCTIIAKGETTVTTVRECVRSMAPKHLEMEGVKMSFEEIEGGIVVVSTAGDSEIITKLHAKAESCGKNDVGGCAKGAHHTKAADAGGCVKGSHHHKAADAACCAKSEHVQKADASCCPKATSKDCESKAGTAAKSS
jgi:hypothetical protein